MEEEGRAKDNDGEKREIGKLAVWSVSSFKPGNGVDLLRDSNIDTYWQSDGAQPHLVNIQFQKKVRLQQLALYVDFKLDESYTPNKISVRAGNSFHDLREIKVVELAEPIGWVYISLCPSDSTKLLCYLIIKMEGTLTFVKLRYMGLVSQWIFSEEGPSCTPLRVPCVCCPLSTPVFVFCSIGSSWTIISSNLNHSFHHISEAAVLDSAHTLVGSEHRDWPPFPIYYSRIQFTFYS